MPSVFTDVVRHCEKLANMSKLFTDDPTMPRESVGVILIYCKYVLNDLEKYFEKESKKII